MSRRLVQFSLGLAGAGAIVVAIGVGGDPADVAGLVAILLGTVLSAPAGRSGDGGWWVLMGVGALLSVLGAVIALIAGIGGLIALLGAAAVLTGAVLGFPTGAPAK